VWKIRVFSRVLCFGLLSESEQWQYKWLEMKSPFRLRPLNGLSCYETQMKNFIRTVVARTREKCHNVRKKQDLFCNHRKYYLCSSWIVSQIMPLNRDKISVFCRKYPQIADVFPNKTHFLSLVKYRKTKINEKRCRIIFTRKHFRL